MSQTFQREDRYIVIKRKDLEKVPAAYRKDLVDPLPWLQTHLPRRDFLVIESDWPEYEPVWRMIEARMTGIPADAEVEVLARVDGMYGDPEAFAEREIVACVELQGLRIGTKLVDLAHVIQLQAEVQQLKGLKPALPPRPPEGDGLPRYGLRWNGPTQPLAVQMDDGYWTPWHLADQLNSELSELKRADECWSAVVSYLLGDGRTQEPLEFLSCWNEGNFEAIRKEWPDAPVEVFYADPLHKGDAPC